MDDLKTSLRQYNDQLSMVNEALRTTENDVERQSLLTLQTNLNQLIELTQESVNALSAKRTNAETSTVELHGQKENPSELDEEYSLFMQEMAKSGAYNTYDQQNTQDNSKNNPDSDNSDIEDELATLLGMKCAVYHTHKWGGQPTLHNAMVSAVVPRQDDDQFKDLKVRVLFTHPTHSEMLPCPFYLDGECKFDDEKCRYSHGTVVELSNLKEAIEPNFDTIKVGSRILLKIKPPDNEDISLTRKATEKYHLWHRAIVKSVDIEKRMSTVKLEQGMNTGEKRKSGSDALYVHFEDVFPLNNEIEINSESDDSLSDTEYPDNKIIRSNDDENRIFLVEKSLQNNAPAMGEWEKHTRGIGSKLMLAMGYVPGTGLGATGDGRLRPVEARVLPVGKSLDHCMAISERANNQDPLKVEQKLKRLQKKEEERNKRAYEREKEKQKRNVFNFLNKTLGDKSENTNQSGSVPSIDIKQSTSKDLNIELFSITEDMRKVEREIGKLNSSLAKYPPGSTEHSNVNKRLLEKNRELNMLRNKEQMISREQKHRKDKEKMSVF